MTPSKITYDFPSDAPKWVLREDGIEAGFIGRLQGLKYEYRPDITNRATLEKNFREKFEALNRVRLTEPSARRDSAHTSREAIPQSPSTARDNSSRLHKKIGNGFAWHTTGSGKTLTSFKASTLLKENDHIHKCVFVVDRKDIDRQTPGDWSSSDKTSSEGEARRVSASSVNQFNKFHEGCVEENTNTAAIVPR